MYQVMQNNQVMAQEDLYTRFISYLDNAPKTVETYKKNIKHLMDFLSSRGITQPQRGDILAYKEELISRGLKPSTIQAYITATKIFFKWTASEGLYPNIADNIKGAKLNRDHKKDYLTGSQVKAVLATAGNKRDYAILALMVTGGLRDIEVSRANIEDLRTLGDSTVLYIQGKGKQEKTDYIKISEPVERAIREYLSSRGNTTGTKPLFTSTSNNSKGGRLSTRTISGIAKQAMRQAGYNSERLTAHSLRHTAVTLSLLAGETLEAVQQFARHANISTTMIYNHALDKSKNTCSQSVSNYIF